MNPTIPALVNQLVKVKPASNDKVEQSAVPRLAAYRNVSSFAPDVLAGWNAADPLI